MAAPRSFRRSAKQIHVDVPNVSAVGLAVFLEVADCLSFREAARRLYMEPSTVSKTVRRVEAELGTRLLLRSTRRVVLTPDGLLAKEVIRGVLDELRALRDTAG